MNGARILLALASGFMLSAALSPAFLAAAGAGPMKEYAYLGFERVCHQIPERSLTLFGERAAVCSRCLGIYAGLFLSCLLLRPPSGGMPRAHLILAAASPMAADILLASLGVLWGGNWTRLATGLLFGLAVPLYLIPAADRAGARLLLFIRNQT